MWAGPESLPTKSAARGEQRLISESERWTVRYARKGARSSPAADEDRGETGLGEVGGDGQEMGGAQVFSGVAATAWMTAARGSGRGTGRPRRYQLRPGDFANGRAQEEDGAGQMFGGVDFAIHPQNFLRARNVHVVDELLAVVAETGAVAGAREFRHPGAARAAVQVQAQLRAEAAQRGQFGGWISARSGLPSKTARKRFSTKTARRRSGAAAFENVERGCGEHAIAQAPEPEDGNPAAPRQTFQNAFHGLFFDFRLVHQHHGDVVANRGRRDGTGRTSSRSGRV
jgi:hypothetical protein